MARTIKIKKKTNKNKRTHISNIAGNKHLLKSYTGSRISKKYKSRINKNKTSRLIKNIKTKRQYNINGDYTTYQQGGFFGTDYLILKWKLHKFNNIISKLNAFDKMIQKDIESYKIQAKDFEARAKEKADLQTEFIDNYRQKIMFEIYKNDPKEAPQGKESIRITIDNSIITLNDNITGISKRIGQLDKGIGKDIPEFNRLTKSFELKVKKFNDISSKYSNLSDFHQELKNLKSKYDEVIGKDKKTVSKAHRKEAKKFEKYKDEYNKILNLTNAELQNRANIKKEIADLLITAEYFTEQFGQYKGKEKKAPGKLDIAFKGIECSGGSGSLCAWVEKYKLFAKDLLLIDTMCDLIIKKMEEIKKSAEICVKNLNTVFESYKKDAHPEAMLNFEKDILDMISLFSDSQKSIALLKAEFYKQTPSSRIMIDYNQLTVTFNYARSKLKVYIKLFDPEVTIPKDTQRGGAYATRGGRGGRSHGARPTSHTPQSRCTNVIKFDKILDNANFYEKKMHHFSNYINVYDDIKNNKAECFSELDNFIIIFENYYKVWLFWQNVARNLNNSATVIPGDIETSLKYLIAINNILDDTDTSSTDLNKWVWDDKLKRFIAGAFSKIKNFEIPKEFLVLKDKNLKEIFDSTSTDSAIVSVRNKPAYQHVKDLVYRIINKLPSDITDDKEFFGVEEWDANVETHGPGGYTGTANVFNNYLDKLYTSIPDTDRTYYPDKTRAPGVTATATSATPIVNVDTGIATIKRLKDEMETNATFPFQNEYYDFLEAINDGLKKQKEKGITAANQNKINTILSEFETKIDNFVNLSTYEIGYYRKEIGLYNGLYLQPLLNAFEMVKTRGYDDTTARKAADEVRKKVEAGSSGDVAVEDVLKMDEFKTKTVSSITAAPGAVVNPPTTITAASVVGATVGATVNDSTKKANNTKKTEKSISDQLKETDVNLIQQVLKRLHIMGEYPIQLNNISAEYVKIHKAFKDLTYGENSLKNISDKLQSITLTLLDLKYIEPKIVGVSVKADTSIRLPMADRIVKAADKDFKDLQKLSITKNLQEHLKKNRILEIYEKETHADDGKLTDLLIAILPFAGDKNQIRQKIYANTDYIATLGNVNNLRRLIEILKSKLDKGSEDSKKKACSILTELATVVGLLDEEPRKIMNDAMYYYDPDAKDKGRLPCYFKDEKRDGGKGGKDGKGGKGDSRGYRGDKGY